MPLYRILVLAGTFFMVALCPRLSMALAVFILGMAFYSLSWGITLYGKKKK
jgi:hypothetical protein